MSIPEHDVIIIGAGLSGIGVARYLKVRTPRKRFVILESKPRIGGTWDLFRYPGIRSDSDMYTMGYAFKPWTDAKAIADGESIRNYVCETARENGLVEHIQFNTTVLSAHYCSATQTWSLEIESEGQRRTITSRFVFSCAGYYRHDQGYLPKWEGYDLYKGTLVHPQFWPQDLDYTDKTVAIIGSGATAVTLTPTLAQKATHVYQVQRSPTYIYSRPGVDSFAMRLRRWLPEKLAYPITRWRIILDGARRRKELAEDVEKVRKLLIGGVTHQLPKHYDWKKHFVPSYLPGQQRICVVPDGDMFKALSDGRASMVTGSIRTFTETGLEMEDGTKVDADIIVTATGLVMHFMGGISLTVDGARVDPSKLLIHKGFMYSNIPNLIYFTGYTNASWTLKVDLVADYACRLLKHMDTRKLTQVVPLAREDDLTNVSRSLKFISGYIVRSAQQLPKHGKSYPWIHEQDYFWDRKTLTRGRIDDGTLTFSNGDAIDLPPSQRLPEAASVAAE